jgi:hypothetical protein
MPAALGELVLACPALGSGVVLGQGFEAFDDEPDDGSHDIAADASSWD